MGNRYKVEVFRNEPNDQDMSWLVPHLESKQMQTGDPFYFAYFHVLKFSVN